MTKKKVLFALIVIFVGIIISLPIAFYSLDFSQLLLGIIGILLLLALFKNPLIGLALVIASPTLIMALPQIPFFTSMGALIGLLTLVFFLIRSRLNFRQTTKLGKMVYFLIFLFLVLSIPGSLFNEAADRNWTFTYFQLLLMVFLIENLVQTKKALISLLVIIYVCIEVSAAFSILNYFHLSQTIPWARATGFSGDPNELAIYNVTAMCIGYYLITCTNSLIKKYAYVALMTISLVSLILSGSRGGVLTLIIVIGCLLAIDLKINLRPVIIGLILVTFVAIPIIQILPENLVSRFKELPQSIIYGDKTVLYRLELWRSSFNVWLDHPIFGVGSGMVTAYKSKNMMYINVDKAYVTHNTYINILAEMGIVGFMIFIGIVLLTGKTYFLAIRQTRDIDIDTYKVAVLLTSILVCWLTAAISLNLQQNKFLWMSFGFALVAGKIRNRTNVVLQLPKRVKNSLARNTF